MTIQKVMEFDSRLKISDECVLQNIPKDQFKKCKIKPEVSNIWNSDTDENHEDIIKLNKPHVNNNSIIRDARTDLRKILAKALFGTPPNRNESLYKKEEALTQVP
ncbi:19954_t:CDS:2 [Racocetra fulgida]|uniref:19954_t:CDS:1 n=1 Tax=Racocetra fulgida TaxID=60492 RepID=A0A9N9B1W4_9GLOM|nr:19954_t:CDS:2 [Racocetra fulgida]